MAFLIVAMGSLPAPKYRLDGLMPTTIWTDSPKTLAASAPGTGIVATWKLTPSYFSASSLMISASCGSSLASSVDEFLERALPASPLRRCACRRRPPGRRRGRPPCRRRSSSTRRSSRQRRGDRPATAWPVRACRRAASLASNSLFDRSPCSWRAWPWHPPRLRRRKFRPRARSSRRREGRSRRNPSWHPSRRRTSWPDRCPRRRGLRSPGTATCSTGPVPRR